MNLGRLNALLGGVFLTSDNMGSYSEKQLADYRELMRMRDAKLTGIDVIGKRINVRYELDGKAGIISFD